jgi:hypothetical protein
MAPPIKRTRIFCPCCNAGLGYEDQILYNSTVDPDSINVHFKPHRYLDTIECDGCGKYFKVKFEGKTITDVEENTEVAPRRSYLDLLVVPPGDKPLFILVKSFDYPHSLNETDQERFDHQKYHYEEHTCPTNWVHSIEAFVFDGDDDPHGFGKLVRRIPLEDLPPEDKHGQREEMLTAYIPELSILKWNEDGEPIAEGAS